MRTYLIAQPCAIMIRGLPKWLDSPLPWVASTRSSPANSQNLTGRSVRAAEQSSSLGVPSTRPLVGPAPNRFGPARAGPSLSSNNAKHSPPERGPRRALLKPRGRGLARHHLPAPPDKYITCTRTLVFFSGARLPRLQPSRLLARYSPHGCCFYYGLTIYDNRHGRQCRLSSDPRLHLYTTLLLTPAQLASSPLHIEAHVSEPRDTLGFSHRPVLACIAFSHAAGQIWCAPL